MSSNINYYPFPRYPGFPSLGNLQNTNSSSSSSENPLLIAYEKSAKENGDAALEVEQKIVQFDQFKSNIQAANNLNSAHATETLKEILYPIIFTHLCEDLCFAKNGQRDAAAGEQLLREDFLMLFDIKDMHGKTPLDHITLCLKEQFDSLCAMKEMNLFAKLLIIHHSILPNGSFSAQTEMVAAQGNIVKAFQELSPKARQLLCKKLEEQKRGNFAPNSDYSTSYNVMKVLLPDKNLISIKECLTELQNQSPCQFVHFATSSETASVAIIKVNQLTYFAKCLQDPSLSKEVLNKEFDQLLPSLQKLIYQLVWLASWQPEENDFSKKLLQSDMRLLLKFQNDEGLDLISQLIQHHLAKAALKTQEVEIGTLLGARAELRQEAFNRLDDPIKEMLRSKLWYLHGGNKNKSFGGPGYGTGKINENIHCLFEPPFYVASTCSQELKVKYAQADNNLLAALKSTKTYHTNPIDVSIKKLESTANRINSISKNLNVAFVTAELSGIASMGGLASSAEGMVKGLGSKNVRVIMPLYRNGPIKDALVKEIEQGATNYNNIYADGQRVTIYKKEHSYEEINENGAKETKTITYYFIDDPRVFTIEKKQNGNAGNFYEDKDYWKLKFRWTVFQKAAADLCLQMSKEENPVELIHIHDAQTALIPKYIRSTRPQAYASGNTPAIVYTFHNNQEPNVYEGEKIRHHIRMMGLPDVNTNSHIEGLLHADVVSTVSNTFAKESQTPNRDFSFGMHETIYKAAADGKFHSFVNGNSNGFNPSEDAQLKDWVSVTGPKKGEKEDLTFGPELTNAELADKIKKIQQELCAYLRQCGYADLDPEKPIVMYLGRYDTKQKGINKLELIMDYTLANGGQFVCVGVEPDPEAKKILERLQHKSGARGNKGSFILIDEKKEDKLIHQSVFGKLLRAASTLPIFPSCYEPCGLVQGEFNRFGKQVIATKTGGFVDTLTTDSSNANGYLFERMPIWEGEGSEPQNAAIIATLSKALIEAKKQQAALYCGTEEEVAPYLDRMRSIMTNALISTWTTTPDGSLTPIDKIKFIYSQALERRNKRGVVRTNLSTLQAEKIDKTAPKE